MVLFLGPYYKAAPLAQGTQKGRELTILCMLVSRVMFKAKRPIEAACLPNKPQKNLKP